MRRDPKAYVLLLAVSLLVSCAAEKDGLTRIVDRKELIFVTRNGPTTYYEGRDGPAGFEYELARRLADDLGVRLKVITEFRVDRLFRRLRRGEADIVGAGLSLLPATEEQYPQISYGTQSLQVIYRLGQDRPRSLEDLEGRDLLVVEDSQAAARLEQARDEGHPGLAWRTLPLADVGALLARIDQGEAELGVVGSRAFRGLRHLRPRLEVAFELSGEEPMVWYLQPGATEDALSRYIDNFFARLRAEGVLETLTQDYFEYMPTVSRVGSLTFVRKMREDLPTYRHLIEQVAREHKLEWPLLAAIAYQESHWDPRAESSTGVRGMMMLTSRTAADLGIEDRVDTLQSLRGGARYFIQLKRRLPDDILEPDRTWLALAAYNIGMGHLEDARVLTERAGKDPHLWSDVMKSLPKLEDIEHYSTVRRGYARGTEAVTYVQNIRHYYDLLNRQSINEQLPAPPLIAEQHLPEALKTLEARAL